MIQRKNKKFSSLGNFVGKLFNSKVFFTAIGLVILVAISIPLAKNVSKQYNINNEVVQLNQEIETLEKKNTEFKEVLNFLESDQYVEEQARKNLNYKKEGEEIVVIKSRDETKENESQKYKGSNQIENNNNLRSNPSKWWNYFFIYD